MDRSPTLEGFRAMFRRPSLGLAEIAWRWSFGFAAAFLLLFALREYLHTLPVSARDLLLLRSGRSALVSQALAHIFRGSGGRVVRALLVVAMASAVAWMLIAALGRAATTKAILGYFSDSGIGDSSNDRWRFRGLVGLNFFRLATTLAAAIGVVAAWMSAAAVSPDSNPAPGSAFLVFLTLVLLVGLAWGMLNWFLSLASMFAVSQNEDSFGAIAAAAGLCRDRLGSVLAVSTWFGLAHIVALVIASSVIAFPVGFAAVLPGGVVFGGVLCVALAYFAVADFLYVGRLAGYLAILEIPAVVFLPEPPIVTGIPHSALSVQPLSSAVDPEELILSDVPPEPPLSS